MLVLDTYEQLRLLDTWLRQELVPGLRDNTRLALGAASRKSPPGSATRGLLAAVPLSNLAAADAGALLRREGLSGANTNRVTRFTHGQPLAFRLASSARGARPDLTIPDAAVATVVTELARVYLSGLDQPTRAVLDAACTLRRQKPCSLLGALLPDVPPHDAYDMLRPLPFVEFGPDGLVLHDTVREVVAALLRVNDPPTYRAHRIAAWRQLRRELRSAPPADLWRYTADLLYLIENPAVREAFFPTASHRYAVEPARRR